MILARKAKLIYLFIFFSVWIVAMEQLEKFQIIFNNPSAIYNAGDTVYGYGWAVFKEPLHVQSKYMCTE